MIESYLPIINIALGMATALLQFRCAVSLRNRRWAWVKLMTRQDHVMVVQAIEIEECQKKSEKPA